MPDLDKLIRDNVKQLIPYSSARDEFTGKEGIFMDANENPYGSLNRYPDPYQAELKSEISRIKGVPVERIFLGNGSDEIIDLCYRIFCNPGFDKALTFFPTYGMYEVSAAINDVDMIRMPLSEEFDIKINSVLPLLRDSHLKLIFICSPNNPTGNSLNIPAIEKIISEFEGIVVIDEAYIDFSEKPSFKTFIERYNNLIVMQTFSKAMGLAAARLGMAFMDPELVHYFNKMKPPYNISAINQKAGLKSLSTMAQSQNRIHIIKAEREKLAAALKKIDIIEKVYPSDSNFLFVKTKNADLIYSILLDNKIIVRNRNKVVPECLRITTGKGNENKMLLKILRSIKL